MRLLIMGDSHMGGLYNALAGPEVVPNMPPWFPSGLVAPTTEVVNAGFGGDTSQVGLDTRLATVVGNGPYDAAVVCYGTNDALWGIALGIPGIIENTVANVLAIAAGLQGVMLAPNRVFCAEPLGGYIIHDPLPNVTVATARNVREHAFVVGRGLRAAGHPLSLYLPQDPAYYNLPADAIHCSPLGYEILARRTVDFLRAEGVEV